MDIGFIGLGNMGGPMCRNLTAKSGRMVRVYDPNSQAVEQCTLAGAKSSADIAAVAEACDVIFMSLPTPKHVLQVVAGEDGLANRAKPGTLVIDFSTISPTAAREAAAALQAKGMRYVEAPVTGGIPRASDGTLMIMAGADEETFQLAEPLLAHVSAQAIHIGPVGAASAAKLINNMLFLCNLATAAEGITMAAKAGLDLGKFVDVVKDGSGFSVGLRFLGRALKGEFAPTFALDLAHKDFDLAMQLENELGVPSIMGASAFSLLKMGKGSGYGALDAGSVLKIYEQFAGVEARLPK